MKEDRKFIQTLSHLGSKFLYTLVSLYSRVESACRPEKANKIVFSKCKQHII